MELGVRFMTKGAGKGFWESVFAPLDSLSSMIHPVINEASDACPLRDGSLFALVPGACILKGEMNPFDRGGVGLGATSEVSPLNVCAVLCLLHQRGWGLDDGEIVVCDHPLGVLEDICQELTNRDGEGGDVGWVA